MKQITIRGVPDELAKALEAECKQRGTSLNKVVLDLLRQGLGVGERPYDNGLSKFAGTWSKDELAEFDRATRMFEAIDEELWR